GAVGRVGALVPVAAGVQLARNARVGVGVTGRQVEVGQVHVDLVVAQAFGNEDRLGAELPLVGTALTDLADHAAGRTAVHGLVAADVGFLLLDRAVGQGEATQVGQR